MTFRIVYFTFACCSFITGHCVPEWLESDLTKC
jgi:hypothetical protein